MASASPLSEEIIEARPGHEGSREGGWVVSMTTSVHRWHAVWFYAWAQHHRCHMHCTQLQEKFYAVNKTLYMTFVDMEIRKAFDHVPRRVIWWALRKLGSDEWLVLLIRSMYENPRSRVHVGCNLREEFRVKMCIHQGSCWNPLLFITVLGALSQEFLAGCPLKNLYADDLVIIIESLEELQQKLILWKTNMERKRLRVNMGKPKSWYLGRDTMCFRSLAKSPVACVTRASAHIAFSAVSFQLDPQEMQWHTWPPEVWCQLQV